MYRKGGCETLVNRVGMPLYRKLAFSRKVTIVVLISQDTTSPAGLTSRFKEPILCRWLLWIYAMFQKIGPI